MRYTILIVFVCLLFIGCSKDKFTTIPQLKYKSVNTTVLDKDGVIRFTLSFTDAEGDLEDSLYVEKVNPQCISSGFVQLYKIPVFPTSSNQQGEIQVTYGYRVPNVPAIKEPQCSFNDTCYFRFVLKDKAQNKSDTVQSETIVIIK